MKKNKLKEQTKEITKIDVDPRMHNCAYRVNDQKATHILSYKEMNNYLAKHAPKNCAEKIHEYLYGFHLRFLVDCVNETVELVKFDYDAAREEYKKEKRAKEFNDVLSCKKNPNQKKKFTRRFRKADDFYRRGAKGDFDF